MFFYGCQGGRICTLAPLSFLGKCFLVRLFSQHVVCVGRDVSISSVAGLGCEMAC